jgi:AraC family transcriptional regulator, regulatory protein of adaptative response / methylated-DNA-[protein]-cysteine methyltransferase
MILEAPTLTFATEAARRSALARRDPAADEHFVYSVRTTGVYCRPSCRARPARPDPCGTRRSPAEAERRGFRPCRRCRPDEPPRAVREAAIVAAACRTIEASEDPPSLGALADAAGMSPHHFHRVFRRVAGVTPRGYADAERQRRVRHELGNGSVVTEAIYAAGFGSSSRFYEAADAILGMTPTTFRDGGAGIEIRSAVGRSTLGAVLVAATRRGLCAILLGDDAGELEADLRRRFPRARFVAAEPGFAATVEAVVRLVDDPASGLDLPLDIRGTAFQRRVWEALRELPAAREVEQRERDRVIGEGDQRIRDHVQQDHVGVPQQAVTVRHEAGAEEPGEEVGHLRSISIISSSPALMSSINIRKAQDFP